MQYFAKPTLEFVNYRTGMEMVNAKKDQQIAFSSENNPSAVYIMGNAFQTDIYKFSASGDPALSWKEV